jgi:hypothetical protein
MNSVSGVTVPSLFITMPCKGTLKGFAAAKLTTIAPVVAKNKSTSASMNANAVLFITAPNKNVLS